MKILWGRSYYNPHLTVENKWGTEMLSNLLRSHSYCNRHHLPKISFFSLGTYPADTSQPLFFFNVFFLFFFISWRLITLQYCSGFCHTLKWISHGFTCVPHPDPLSHLPLHPLPPGPPRAQVRTLVSCIQPGLVICFTLDNIHVSVLFYRNIPPSPSPTESKRLFYTSVSLFLFCI